MPLLLWDASALAKRYIIEIGSDTVDALFDALPFASMRAPLWGYAETFAILVRRRNGGQISAIAFAEAVANLQTEILLSPDFGLLAIDDNAILDGLGHILQHNINSADAAILAAFQQYIHSLPLGSPSCILVASDRHLLRAANAEGLTTLNPELMTASDIPAFLASL